MHNLFGNHHGKFDANLYDSLEHQLFCEKWHVSGVIEDYPQWNNMVSHLFEDLDNKNFHVISERVTIAYGLNKKSDFISPDEYEEVKPSENPEALKKALKNEIEIWKPENLLKLFNEYFVYYYQKNPPNISEIESFALKIRNKVLIPLIKNFVNAGRHSIGLSDYEIQPVIDRYEAIIFQIKKQLAQPSEDVSGLTNFTETQIDKIVSFWQSQAFFNIDTNIFKKNLTQLLKHFMDDSLLLSVDHGATKPLHQLVYGGEYAGLHFENAKDSAKNNYDDHVYNNLHMKGWIDKQINMRIMNDRKITYSMGYNLPYQDLNHWENNLGSEQEGDNVKQTHAIQPNSELNLPDPATIYRTKLEKIWQMIEPQSFHQLRDLHAGAKKLQLEQAIYHHKVKSHKWHSNDTHEILTIVFDAFINTSYSTKTGYLSIAEKIAKTLEGKTKTTRGTLFGFGARTSSTVKLYEAILKELEEDLYHKQASSQENKMTHTG